MRAALHATRALLSTPILLVATATRWLAAARMPKPLSRAGCEVTLLAPGDSLAEHSRYIEKVGYLPDQATPAAWILLPAAAESLGIPVPPFIVTTDASAAQAFAGTRSYPIVLKRAHSSAADGVRICDSARSLAVAFGELQQPRATDFDGTANRILVQAHIDGPIKNYPVMTWKGKVLTGYAAEKHAALHGESPATRAGFNPRENHISVHFPQEWLRDPGSAWLRSHPVDVPWDEPELIEAMLALRHA